MKGGRMKCPKSIAYILLPCLIAPAVLVITTSVAANKRVVLEASFRMDILNDGELSENNILVDLRIFSDGGKTHVDWNHVYIDPVHETKTVILKAQHFSTLEGSIRNVQASEGHFSFVMDLSLTPLGTGRTVQVVGSKGEGQDKYDVRATGLWWSEILKRKLKIKWRTTDKKIVLPYREVF
jgi:hypothetical protein